MKSLPYSIFKVVQGLCFPNKAEILCLGEWDTADWSCTQTIVDKLTTNTDVVILPVNHSNASTILQKSTHIDYKFHVVIYGHVFEEIEQLCIDFQPEIIEARSSYVGILVHEFGKKSYLVNKIDSGDVIEIDNPTFFVPQFNIENWSQNGNQIYLAHQKLRLNSLFLMIFHYREHLLTYFGLSNMYFYHHGTINIISIGCLLVALETFPASLFQEV